MWELLRDPIWQGIGAVIGVAGIVSAITLGVVLYLLQRHRKELGYRVLSHTRVVSVEAEVAERVQVLYEGQPVRDVHLVEVEVVNSGNEAIVVQDYEYPLAIGTGEKSRVLTAVLVEAEPEGLPAWPIISESGDTVRVQPLLLNPGDSFKVRILVSEFAGAVDVSTRIVGVKEIRELPEGAGTLKRAVVIGVAALAYCVPVGVALVKAWQAMSQSSTPLALGWIAVAAVWIPLWIAWAPRAMDRYLAS